MNVTNPTVMKELLARYGFHFSKSKGQNFLTQRWVPQRIAEESGVDEGCGVVEIGPGFGPLTQELCLRAGKVIALEVDTTLKPVLAETVGEFDNLEIIFTDAMKADLPQLIEEKLPGLKPMACANLPYYITSPVLTKLLESRCFSSVTVMVQKEVAQRICSKAGSSDYSAFTVFCNYYAQPKLLFDVPPNCFMPQPKVTSAVLTLKMRSEPVAEILDEGLFFRVVRAAFAQRRKTLLNALASGLGGMSKEDLTAVLESCGVSPTVRGETLDIPAFAAIANAIHAVR
ncbi:MAG: 16S rRNA (adenine(1518)-N(6)/adenine(1519)-N(6))-dimethyltransferase RsmA [Oscillospiraceae bacterium]|nr:16S rRNA (adenine(1518)-N(6)/adenine(1519)-N(6))-dimethyltransferase RsmA [Oscillospiraceae bacterium]